MSKTRKLRGGVRTETTRRQKLLQRLRFAKASRSRARRGLFIKPITKVNNKKKSIRLSKTNLQRIRNGLFDDNNNSNNSNNNSNNSNNNSNSSTNNITNAKVVNCALYLKEVCKSYLEKVIKELKIIINKHNIGIYSNYIMQIKEVNYEIFNRNDMVISEKEDHEYIEELIEFIEYNIEVMSTYLAQVMEETMRVANEKMKSRRGNLENFKFVELFGKAKI